MPDTAIIWCAVSSKAQIGDDKLSLYEQERSARAWCEANGYRVMQVLTVPGLSRSESDTIPPDNVPAYHELRALWQAKSFDVLVCHDVSRLGRSQTLISWVIENVVQSGAAIYSLDTGWIDSDSYRMMISMASFGATSHMDSMRKKARATIKARIADGGWWAETPITHVKDTDSMTLRVDETHRALWDAMGDLMLDGLGYRSIDAALNDMGFVHPQTGKKLYKAFTYRIMLAPHTWGNTALRYKGAKRGIWAFDPTVPPPDSVIVWYGTCEAVYTGQRAIDLQSEIRRRTTMIVGRRRPKTTNPFSGLIVCDHCGHRLSWHGNGYYRCPKRWDAGTWCDNSSNIRLDTVQSYVDTLLHAILDDGDFLHAETQDDTEARIDALRVEIDRAKQGLATLINKQALADTDTLASAYDDAIQARARDIDALQAQLRTMETQQRQAQNEARIGAIDSIKEMSIAEFWALPVHKQNQLLKALFGDYCMVMRGRKIIAVQVV